jgi:hypothetical protein
LNAGAHSTRIDCLPRTTYGNTGQGVLERCYTYGERELQCDELTNAGEASAQSPLGYEGESLEKKSSTRWTFLTNAFETLTSDADDAFFVQKSVINLTNNLDY